MIEMMISMVLGLFLILGLTTMYLGSKKSDKVRDAVSDIEENARLTLNSIRDAIEHAGYRTVDNIPLDKPFYTPADGALQNEACNGSGNSIVNADLLDPPLALQGYTKDGDVEDLESDIITVVYRPDYPIAKETDPDYPHGGPVYFDCSGDAFSNIVDDDTRKTTQKACSTDPASGMADPWKARIYNALYVDASKQLVCLGSRSTTPSVLSGNIENMQIRYGVTTTDTSGKRQTSYKKADDVEANNQWEAVTSVQVAILIASEKEVLDKAESHDFTLLDEDISLDADRKIYRKFSTTINLPNRTRREMQQVSRTSAENT